MSRRSRGSSPPLTVPSRTYDSEARGSGTSEDEVCPEPSYFGETFVGVDSRLSLGSFETTPSTLLRGRPVPTVGSSGSLRKGGRVEGDRERTVAEVIEVVCVREARPPDSNHL